MEKRVTMKHIANQLGLSINAVSLALNDRVGVSEETRRQVLRLAEEMGYLNNYSKYVSTYSSKNICILLKTIYFRDMHFYSKILLGIEEEAKKNGFDVFVNFFEEDKAIPNCIENRRVAGVVVVGKIDDDYLLQLKSYEVPVVLVDHTSLAESTDSILTDNKLGAFKATKYLIEKGYTKIGFLGDLDYSLSVKERFFGYQEALKMLPGIRTYEEVAYYSNQYSILNDIEKFILGNDTQSIVESLGKIVSMPQVFVCSNDSAAIQLSNALKLLGYNVPEDIGVVGFDDIDLCLMISPKLTTVRVNKERMGRKAIEKLLWRLSHRKEPIENTVMDVEIVERESVR